MFPRIVGIYFPKKGCKDQSTFNNACPDERARCYLLAVIRPAVDQRREKQQVSISPDESLACQGGGGIFCQDRTSAALFAELFMIAATRETRQKQFEKQPGAATPLSDGWVRIRMASV